MIDITTHNVLLCGTQYGRTYLPAIFESPSLELAGILARGSSRSVRLAEQSGVPLYQNLEALDEPIDLACVAVGGETGVALAHELIRKEIPVLIEHPVSVTDCRLLLKAATDNETHCHINGHFADLPPAKDFIKASQKLNEGFRPQLITCLANTRTLYSLLDMLIRSFGVFEPLSLSFSSLGDKQAYTSCNFSLNGIPVQLIVQTWKGEQDDSRDAPLGHQITVTYPIGTLQLTGTYGTCSWHALVAAIPDRSVPTTFTSSGSSGSVIAQITDWRIKANQAALTDLLAQVEGGIAASHQSHDYLMALTGAWSNIMAQIRTSIKHGIPEGVPEKYWNPFT